MILHLEGRTREAAMGRESARDRMGERPDGLEALPGIDEFGERRLFHRPVGVLDGDGRAGNALDRMHHGEAAPIGEKVAFRLRLRRKA